jgi:hypothetical protein
MAFDSKFRNFGVAKVDSEGKYVWVYWSDNNSCRESIWIQGGKAINAHWAGDCIIVSMADGKIRRYESFGTYTVM